MQGSVEDKILANISGKPVFIYSIQTFLSAGVVDRFEIVYRDETQREQLSAAIESIDVKNTKISYTRGGKERQDSVFEALLAQDADCQQVYIHDCARPLVGKQNLLDLASALAKSRAVVLAHKVSDTIKRVPDSIDQPVELEDLDRRRLWAMETPQAFDYQTILTAYQMVKDRGETVTDDTAAAARLGIDCLIVANPSPNPKITTPADLAYIEWYYRSQK